MRALQYGGGLVADEPADKQEFDAEEQYESGGGQVDHQARDEHPGTISATEVF